MATGVPVDDAEGCVPVAVEIPSGEPTQRKWIREMAEFVEPMRTNCGKLFWAGVVCNPHTWKANAFKRADGARNWQMFSYSL